MPRESSFDKSMNQALDKVTKAPIVQKIANQQMYLTEKEFETEILNSITESERLRNDRLGIDKTNEVLTEKVKKKKKKMNNN